MVGMSSMFPETGGVGDRLAGIERRLSALETAPRLTSASIGSGGLSIKGGGKLQLVDASGAVLVQLDTEGGLKIYDTDGTTEKVVLDGTGLEVDGGAVRALNGVAGYNATTTATLTATRGEKVAAFIALPVWTQEALVVATATVQSGNSGTFPFGILCGVAVDGVERMVLQQDIDPGKTQSVTVSRAITVANPTSPLKVSCTAGRSGGSGDQSNVACTASGLVIALR